MHAFCDERLLDYSSEKGGAVMNKRGWTALFAGICMTAVLGGCYEPLPITEREMDCVAEYAAGVLVKYGTDSEELLYNRKEQEQVAKLTVIPTTRPTKQPAKPTQPVKPEPTGSAGEKPTKKLSPTPIPTPTPEKLSMQEFTRILDKGDFFFGFKDYRVTKEYKGEGGLVARAASGKTLIVLEFIITNLDTKQNVLSINKGSKKEFALTLRTGKISILPSPTILQEDIYTGYETLYKAGETKRGVVVFECKESEVGEFIDLAVLKEGDKKDDSVLLKIK